MKKPTLLYVSPFWPKKSGISEYSEALINGLDVFFEITLVIDDYKVENKQIREKYDIIKYSPNVDFSGYDYIIYNFGNNPEYHWYMYEMIQKYSGYVILHDYILYYLTVGYYAERNVLFQKIYELEGIRGIQLVKESLKKTESRDLLHHKGISAMLPLNKEIIGSAKGIFVHSLYSKKLIEKNYIKKDIYVIQHLKTLLSRDESEIKEKDYLNKRFRIKEGSYILGAVGFIGPSKQNELTCTAVKKYNKTHQDKVFYVMIGDGNYVDHMLDEHIFKTGFLNNEEFFKAINSCDIIINLRYPYNGEASGTLIQCMDMGKPCIVTDIGWFSEIPDDSVIKLPENISADVLFNVIEELKEKNLSELIINAKSFIENECIPDKVAKDLYSKLKNG